MSNSMAASHSVGKVLKDVIFGASAACGEAVKKYGADKVTNGTIGAIMDDNGKLICIPTVEKVLRSLPANELAAYAPIAGLPAYIEAVKNLTFADNKPEGYLEAVATAGGTGAIHNTICNYSEIGDSILTSDWFWGNYSVMCNEAGRKLETYKLLDEAMNFNIEAFTDKVTKLLADQDSLLVIINTPAHNPTGFSLTEEDWDKVLDVCKEHVKGGDKKITILVDIAYIDYAGDKNESRKFMKKFSNLPDNILTVFAFSMSKGHTLYGQRTGAMIGLSANKEIATEFLNINKYTSRSTWSNINRGAMATLAAIDQDKTLLAQFEAERNAIYETIKERGAIFMQEAAQCGLKALPYKAGFFLSIPSSDPAAVCEKLHDDLIFAVPLKRGVRIAVCSISAEKMHGVAEKTLKAWNFVENNK